MRLSELPLRVLLLMEDEGEALLVRRCVEAGMAEMAASVVTAGSASEALRLLADLTRELLVVDYRLPGKGAVRFLHEVERSGFDLPALVVTPVEDAEAAVEATRWGPFDLLFKDRLEPALVAAAVRRSLELHRARLVRRRAEEELERSEERYRSVVEMTQEGIWLLGVDRQTISVNGRLAQMLGVPREKLAASSIRDYLDDDGMASLHRGLDTVGPGAGGSRLELTFRRPDGSELASQVSLGMMSSKRGAPLGGLVMVTDVTARRMAERSLNEVNERLARSVAELEQRAARMSLVLGMSDLLHACRAPEEAYAIVAQHMTKLFPQDSGALSITNASGTLAVVSASWGAAPPAEGRLALDECWAIRSGRPHGLDPEGSAIRCSHHPPGFEAGALCLPLMAEGRAMGALHLGFAHAGVVAGGASRAGVDAMKSTLAIGVAEHFALALANLGLRENLRRQSVRDPLSGVFNRRYMEASLERELTRASRYSKPVGLIMIDLDGFKEFNDRYGHEAGDLVIRQTGELLRRRVRSDDIVCRFGGEEFVVIMPDSPLDHTLRRAELLRGEVRAERLQYRGETLPEVTLSAGVAVYPEHGERSVDLLRAADEALYRAKDSGRDQVAAAGTGTRCDVQRATDAAGHAT